MKTEVLLDSLAARFCFGLAVPLLAAQPASPGTATDPPTKKIVAAASQPADTVALKLAQTCLDDVRAFNNQMQKGGFRRGGSDYGYGIGHPMGSCQVGTGWQAHVTKVTAN